MLIFRILVQICKTKAFQKLNPAEFDLRDEIKEAILVSNKRGPVHLPGSWMTDYMVFVCQTGTQEWFSIKRGLHQPMTKVKELALLCLM